MNKEVLYPEHYQIFIREPEKWVYLKSKVFYNPKKKPIDLEAILERYSLTKSNVVCELFKINGGYLGYYLANLREKKYYYCGTEALDVKAKLLSLGIGRLSINI